MRNLRKRPSTPTMRHLQGRRVLITGAATGIGRAIATAMLAAGARVGLYDIDEAQLTQTASRLAHQYGPAQFCTGLLDVRQASDWERALAQFDQQMGGLDLLINNAGIAYSGPLTTHALSDYERMIQINVMGVLNGCYLALPYLKRSPCPRVINLCSASAFLGQPALAVYSASKFAVRGLSEALDAEWADDGIRVMDLMPIFVRSAMTDDMQAPSLSRLGRHLMPEDIAQMALKVATATSPLAPTHWPVGKYMNFIYHFGVGPDFAKRWINRRIGT